MIRPCIEKYLNEHTLKALKDGSLSRDEMEICANRAISLAYKNEKEKKLFYCYLS